MQVGDIKSEFVEQKIDNFLNLAAQPQECAYDIFLRDVAGVGGLLDDGLDFLQFLLALPLLQLHLIDDNLEQLDFLLGHKVGGWVVLC